MTTMFQAMPHMLRTFPFAQGDRDDAAELMAEVLRMPLQPVPPNSGTARGANTREGWIQGLSTARFIPENLPYHMYPTIHQAIDELEDMCALHGRCRSIMVNRLEPYGHLDAHRDDLPNLRRFHLPIMTNPTATWWDEVNGHIHMRPFIWYGPVNYCGWLHAMKNGGSPRYHLVVDFK